MKNKKEVQCENALTAYLVSGKDYKPPLPVSHAEVRVPVTHDTESNMNNPLAFSKETERRLTQEALNVDTPTQSNNTLQLRKEDIIGHPNHYCEGRKYEPKDVIRDWNLNFNLGNAVKYISRNGRKEGNTSLQDLKKARQYLDFEIEYIEKEEK